MKQLGDGPCETAGGGIGTGQVGTGTVTSVNGGGLELALPGDATGGIRRAELARDRGDQRPDRFAVGEKVDAKVTSIDRSARRITLSIKALESEEEKKAMAQFGATDSGASLGDILGAALRGRQAAARADEDDEK